VISKEYGKFRAREKVRRFPKDTSLSIIVPKGANYGYDIISAVGLGSFLEGRKLSAIQQELASQIPHFNIPYSSLYDQQKKFLYYFGELHRASMPLIKDYLDSFGKISWLIDGTVEQGSDVFFGVKECQKDILLDCYKIATENETDIVKCLLDVGANFGRPFEIIHDLSQAIRNACKTAYSDIIQRVCHFHFTRDVGNDLYDQPHDMLFKQLKKIKLKVHLKDQRRNQSKWLRNRVDDKDNLIVEKLLKGIDIPTIDNEIFVRELFLSLNHWLLDYANDGKRQGYPFDPYLLYFHRRSITVHHAVKRILESSVSESDIPKCLMYLSTRLESYLSDPQIIKASSLYEKAFSIFSDIRVSLRLLDGAKSSAPIYESYEISSLQQREILKNISDLKGQLNTQMQSIDDEKEKKLYEIASKHIEKYEPYLINESNINDNTEKITRTTNKLEQAWGSAKRTKRQITGKKKLTREFNALPKEYMLVQNLKNPDYVDLVLGDIEKLPQKLADVGSHAKSFSSWLKKQDIKNLGRISKNTLRKDKFIEDLVEISKNSFNAN